MPNTFKITLADLTLKDQVQFGNTVRATDVYANPDRSRVVELYECDEGEIDRTLPFNEVFYCLKGEEEVHNLDTGEIHHVKAGDVFVFEKGARVHVTYKSPFRALFVFLSDDDFRVDEYGEGL